MPATVMCPVCGHEYVHTVTLRRGELGPSGAAEVKAVKAAFEGRMARIWGEGRT